VDADTEGVAGALLLLVIVGIIASAPVIPRTWGSVTTESAVRGDDDDRGDFSDDFSGFPLRSNINGELRDDDSDDGVDEVEDEVAISESDTDRCTTSGAVKKTGVEPTDLCRGGLVSIGGVDDGRAGFIIAQSSSGIARRRRCVIRDSTS
jgi:hypothetical protein